MSDLNLKALNEIVSFFGVDIIKQVVDGDMEVITQDVYDGGFLSSMDAPIGDIIIHAIEIFTIMIGGSQVLHEIMTGKIQACVRETHINLDKDPEPVTGWTVISHDMQGVHAKNEIKIGFIPVKEDSIPYKDVEPTLEGSRLANATLIEEVLKHPNLLPKGFWGKHGRVAVFAGTKYSHFVDRGKISMSRAACLIKGNEAGFVSNSFICLERHMKMDKSIFFVTLE